MERYRQNPKSFARKALTNKQGKLPAVKQMARAVREAMNASRTPDDIKFFGEVLFKHFIALFHSDPYFRAKVTNQLPLYFDLLLKSFQGKKFFYSLYLQWLKQSQPEHIVQWHNFLPSPSIKAINNQYTEVLFEKERMLFRLRHPPLEYSSLEKLNFYHDELIRLDLAYQRTKAQIYSEGVDLTLQLVSRICAQADNHEVKYAIHAIKQGYENKKDLTIGTEETRCHGSLLI